jgi:hypothetical protein
MVVAKKLRARIIGTAPGKAKNEGRFGEKKNKEVW